MDVRISMPLHLLVAYWPSEKLHEYANLIVSNTVTMKNHRPNSEIYDPYK